MPKKKTDTDVSLLPVKVQESLTVERKSAQESLAMIVNLAITSQADLDFAGELLGLTKSKIKELEAQRTSVTGPLNQAVKTVNGWFKPVTEFYGSCEKALKEKIATHMLAEQAKQDAALREIEAGAGDASPEAFAAATSVHEAPKNVSLKPRFKWTVTNWAIIPGRFKKMVLAEDLVEREIAEHGINANIPGLLIERDMGIIGRST